MVLPDIFSKAFLLLSSCYKHCNTGAPECLGSVSDAALLLSQTWKCCPLGHLGSGVLMLLAPCYKHRETAHLNA